MKDIVLRRLLPEEFRARLPELVSVYTAAMRYTDGIAHARMEMWAEHSRREDFICLVAIDPTDAIRALVYGYRGLPGQWWYSEVERGLPADKKAWVKDFFELTELHVRPDSQGAGLGQRMLTAILVDRPETIVLLSTPEGTNRAWQLYRRMRFVDVLRDYRFTGDFRPFGILGRALPLEPDLADQTPGG